MEVEVIESDLNLLPETNTLVNEILTSSPVETSTPKR